VRLEEPAADERQIRLGQRRDDGEEIPDDSEIGDPEDRRLRVLVDGHDVLGSRHPREMLDGARHAGRNIEVGPDHASGLTDLMLVIDPPGVDRRPRGANRSAECVGQIANQREIRRFLQTAPAGNDDVGLGDAQLARFRRPGLHDLRFGRGRLERHVDHRGR